MGVTALPRPLEALLHLGIGKNLSKAVQPMADIARVQGITPSVDDALNVPYILWTPGYSLVDDQILSRADADPFAGF